MAKPTKRTQNSELRAFHNLQAKQRRLNKTELGQNLVPLAA